VLQERAQTAVDSLTEELPTNGKTKRAFAKDA
jgi:hypothetical protein